MAKTNMANIESRLAELENITKTMENGNLSIDEAIASYSKGIELALSCKQSLDELTQKVTFAKEQVANKLNINNQSE